MSGISRRAVLAHGGLVAGAATSGGFGWRLAHPDPDTPSTPSTLHVVGLRVLDHQRLVVGATRTLHGEVCLVEGGPAVGSFFASGVVLAPPDLVQPGLGLLEHQLLTLPGGTLTATGTVTHDGAGTFTVTGGSGALAHVRGSYATLQRADHSGSGSAQITFSAQEDAWPSRLS